MPSLLLCCLLVSAWFVVPRRRDYVTRCEELMKRLPPHLIEPLDLYVGTLLLGRHDREFWVRSGGLKGQMRRLPIMFLFLQLIQIHYQTKRISAKDAAYIWGRVLLQIGYTALAVPEAGVCWMIQEIPHIAARLSVTAHHQLILRTDSLCARKDAAACLQDLDRLL